MSGSEPRLFVGIDVQVRRPCAFAALDIQLKMLRSGWLEDRDPERACDQLAAELASLGYAPSTVAIGIDAPRQPLENRRPFFWDRAHSRWRKRRPTEKGWGRHCEVIIKGAGVGNPQWTPPVSESPQWMQLGFGLFRRLEDRGFLVHEVFPSAAYNLLEGVNHSPVQITFSSFRPGVKDMADACISAFTIHEFHLERGTAVGSDGLGPIVIPRPLPKNTPDSLLRWPSQIHSSQLDD